MGCVTFRISRCVDHEHIILPKGIVASSLAFRSHPPLLFDRITLLSFFFFFFFLFFFFLFFFPFLSFYLFFISIRIQHTFLLLYRKEGRTFLFNDALNTFYLRLYGVRHMVKDHSDSERGNSLPPHGLLFPNSSKFKKKKKYICTIPQTG